MINLITWKMSSEYRKSISILELSWKKNCLHNIAQITFSINLAVHFNLVLKECCGYPPNIIFSHNIIIQDVENITALNELMYI